MSASNPILTSAHASLPRHSDMDYASRTKRSDSVHFEHTGLRGPFDAASRMQDLGDESTFIPTSLGEHLLERTYLEDVVRPLVRALVKARMTYGINGEATTETSHAYVDLEKLRRELERATQRARHAEQQRDDLARRLDLAGIPDDPRERVDRHSDHMGPSEFNSSAARSHGVPFKRPRPSDYEQRASASASASAAISVSVGQSDGPSASVIVNSEGPHGVPMTQVSRPPHPTLTSEPMSPPPSMSYNHLGAPRHGRPFVDGHHNPHEPDQRPLTRMPLTTSALESDYAYPDERPTERYAMTPSNQPAPHRPPLSRFSGMSSARSPPSSSAYLTSGSERSSMPTLHTYPSTSSTSSFGAGHYSGGGSAGNMHPYDHEGDDQRRMARLRPGGHESVDHLSVPGRPASANYVMTPTSETSYPVRKLASTKNRTCSNCAAPHDAKFRRGPKGPGTLCDRCGSRWKKFKEQENASSRRDSHPHQVNETGNSAMASASASASANARLSSTSASSQSPVERAAEDGTGRGPGVAEGGAGGEEVDTVEVEGAQRDRERSASVDQLVDE